MNTTTSKNGIQIMQGKTTLESGETFLHGENKGLNVVCRECSKPFSESLLVGGIVLDAVVCSRCENQMAFVVNKIEVSK